MAETTNTDTTDAEPANAEPIDAVLAASGLVTHPAKRYFTKHHGLGNDFLINLTEGLPDDGADLARHLCDRRTGIGADGLIFGLDLEPGSTATRYQFVLFNADGSQAEVSGNGLRCFGQAIARARGTVGLDIVAETAGGPRRLTIRAGEAAGPAPATIMASVEMGPIAPGIEVPEDLADVLAFEASEPVAGVASATRWGSGDIGNPHLVFEVPDVEAVDLPALGRACEERFGGMNVEIVQPGAQQGEVIMRVWERGVGLTQACGSGACVSAKLARDWGLVGDMVSVVMPGGAAAVLLDEDEAVLRGPTTFVAGVEVTRG